VPLVNATTSSAPCDAVHSGIVQIFQNGVWGLICTQRFSFRSGSINFDIDANVVCRQLGFPQGTVFDTSSTGDRGSDNTYDYDDYSFLTTTETLDDVPVFANRVSCTGKEERLDDCFFPERDAPSPFSDYSSAPAPGPEADFGLGGSCNLFQAARLGVVCHRFALEGAQERVCRHVDEAGVPSVAWLASAGLAVTRYRSQQPLRALMLRLAVLDLHSRDQVAAAMPRER